RRPASVAPAISPEPEREGQERAKSPHPDQSIEDHWLPRSSGRTRCDSGHVWMAPRVLIRRVLPHVRVEIVLLPSCLPCPKLFDELHGLGQLSAVTVSDGAVFT